MISIHVCATAISGLLRSSSVKPTALSIARAGAREGPSTRTLLLDRREFLLSLSAICFLFPAAIGSRGRERLMICITARAPAKSRPTASNGRDIQHGRLSGYVLAIYNEC